MDALPEKNADYGTQEYWEARYTKEDPNTTFDWFKTYHELQSIFQQECPDKEANVLMLGSGNSTLSEDMYRDGYHNITNVDFSKSVIEHMRERCRDMPSMRWELMDIRDLQLTDQSFDVVIDKGTMDALMCEQGDVWEPSAELVHQVEQEVNEVVRVLRPGGKFIYITFGQPHFRRRYLQRPELSLEIRTIGDAFHYFVYVATKITSS
ncbi:hypothetical protein IWQ62_003848 [Dispira parvispora]|uniref:Methyltransferase domain-containing protein n=1 Tax=Dispira parvispora TaxID=1520584 RepID=A0A9W8E192_9FUNG|nr:hypothetical protein IWQ62_003848 [Dispira parvispora]